MLCDARILVPWRARPRGFVALMGLYESNYLRFLQLAGDPRLLQGTSLSCVAGDCQLQLTVLEHMRYTSTLTLTYLLATAPGAAFESLPDLRLRAYHDARLLEAEAFGAQGAAHGGAPRVERGLPQRWARNMMLNKWLEYCAERGHRFTRREPAG